MKRKQRDAVTTRTFAALEKLYGRNGRRAGERYHVSDMYTLARNLHPGLQVPAFIDESLRCKVQRAPNTESLGDGFWRFTTPQNTKEEIMKPITQRTWTADEMRAVEPITFNRNVERHVKQIDDFDPSSPAYATHFATVYVEDHRKWYRINGNTRCHNDEIGKVPLPPILYGEEYVVATWAEALALYEKIDSTVPTKKAKDQFHTAVSFNGIDPKSHFFAADKGTSALTVAYNAFHGRKSNSRDVPLPVLIAKLDERDLIEPVDTLLYDCGVTSNKVATHASVVATMILSRAKVLFGVPKAADRERAARDWVAYWTDFHNSKGKLEGTGTSPYNTAWEAVRELAKGGQREELYEACERLLYCFDNRDKERILKMTRLPSLADYVVLWSDREDATALGERELEPA